MSTRVAIIAENDGLFDAYKVFNVATRKVVGKQMCLLFLTD